MYSYNEIRKKVHVLCKSHTVATSTEITDMCRQLLNCKSYPSIWGYQKCFLTLSKHPHFDILEVFVMLAEQNAFEWSKGVIIPVGDDRSDAMHICVRFSDFTEKRYKKAARERAKTIRLAVYLSLRRTPLGMVKEICKIIANNAHLDVIKTYLV